MTREELLKMTGWIADQYRMAIEFNRGYMPALRDIVDSVEAGKITPAEAKRLFAEYEKAKEEMDRHIAEVKEIESELNIKLHGENFAD